MVFVNNILDNVHGLIGLTEVENEIEKLPIFQRLRRIKQLGLANWIFPGAEHTRYIHSLGVMHIIDKMSINLDFSKEERQLVRLSGMLHDIGHYPLSHVGESAFKYKNEEIENYIKQNIIDFKNSIEGLNKEDILGSVTTKTSNNIFHHENIGVEVIRNNTEIQRLIKKYCPYIDIEDICDIITGNLDRNINLADKVQLLHSELDADRMDYMVRDAVSSGAAYGSFDINAMVGNLSKKRHSKYNVEVVGVKTKGVALADQFLVNRYFSYSQVIFHKHVSVLCYMAKMVMTWMINSSAFNYFPSKDNLLEWIRDHEKNSSFLEFTDQYFLNILSKVSKEKDGCPDEIYKMVENLKAYKVLNLKNPSVDFSSSNKEELIKKIKDTDIYKEAFDEVDLKTLYLIDSVSITSNVPMDKFCRIYDKAKESNLDLKALDYYLKERILSGISVIPKEGDPYLLIDTEYSLIKDLSRHTLANIREYDF